ncbi:MAG: type II toxin-antitoxin system RelE/ParE family toxin [Pseudomonadota bacterium]
MSKPFRLTRQAEESLIEIARWTIEAFGARQAEIYESELIARCIAVANGEVASRRCDLLIEGAEDLRYCRAGEHFLVFREQHDLVVIVDILHSRSDLPRHIAGLSARLTD